MISSSPDRNTFQKEGYIKRCEEQGKVPDAAYIQMYTNWQQQKLELEETNEKTLMQRLSEVSEVVFPAVLENTEIYNSRMKKSFDKFKEWWDKQDGLELVFTEQKVLSRVHKFTGTLDALFKKGNDYVIYDWKTSSNIRDSYFCQCYLYVIALEEMMDIKIKKGVIVNCTKDGKLRIAEFDIDSDNHDTALSCLKLYQFLNKKEK